MPSQVFITKLLGEDSFYYAHDFIISDKRMYKESGLHLHQKRFFVCDLIANQPSQYAVYDDPEGIWGIGSVKVTDICQKQVVNKKTKLSRTSAKYVNPLRSFQNLIDEMHGLSGVSHRENERKESPSNCIQSSRHGGAIRDFVADTKRSQDTKETSNIDAILRSRTYRGMTSNRGQETTSATQVEISACVGATEQSHDSEDEVTAGTGAHAHTGTHAHTGAHTHTGTHAPTGTHAEGIADSVVDTKSSSHGTEVVETDLETRTGLCDGVEPNTKAETRTKNNDEESADIHTETDPTKTNNRIIGDGADRQAETDGWTTTVDDGNAEGNTVTIDFIDLDDDQASCGQEKRSKTSHDTARFMNGEKKPGEVTKHHRFSALKNAGSFQCGDSSHETALEQVVEVSLISPLSPAQVEQFGNAGYGTGWQFFSGVVGKRKTPKDIALETFTNEASLKLNLGTVTNMPSSDNGGVSEENKTRSTPLTVPRSATNEVFFDSKPVKHTKENKTGQNRLHQKSFFRTEKKVQFSMVQDNRHCQTENVVVVTEAKTTVCRNAQQTRYGGDSKARDKTTVSMGRSVEREDNTQCHAMMKDGTQVEERQTIFLTPKMRGAPFREERAFHTGGMESFPELQKVSENIDRIASSLSCKDTGYFDHGYSKEASLGFLRRARNEALLPAGIFDVQTVAPSTLYDPIAFFRSPLERLRWEFWRLCTFAPLSDNLSVSPIRLAQSGFYYDEEQDNIICFSCGLRKRHWSENEKTVAVVHLALNEHCLQANFADNTNVAIETDTPRLSSTPGAGQPQSEVSPRISRDDSIRNNSEVHDGLPFSESSESAFSRNQYRFNGVTTANHTPEPVSQRSSQNGHTAAILSRNEQTGQAYSLPSSISRAEEISRHQQLAALSAGTALQQTVVSSCPSASYTQITQSQATNVPAAAAEAAADHSQYPVQPEQAPEAVPPETLRYGSRGNSEEHSALESDGDHSEASGLDMRRAACPENSSVKGRLATFGDWPGAGLPTPRDLVPAGFYYMGTGDSVRCFYCGVTLRNWREHDDPWLTHVRFRFSCAYVTAIKGENFVLHALMKHANGQPVTGEAEQTER